MEGLQRRQELLPDESGDLAAGTAAAGGSGYADVNELKRELLGVRETRIYYFHNKIILLFVGRRLRPSQRGASGCRRPGALLCP